MEIFEREQIKKMNATLREIAKGFTRVGNEIAKLRETIEKSGYAVLPTIEMTEEKGEEDNDGTEE